MEDFLIEDLDPELERLLAERAQATGRSIADEVHVLLRQVLLPKGGAYGGSTAPSPGVAGDEQQHDELPASPAQLR